MPINPRRSPTKVRARANRQSVLAIASGLVSGPVACCQVSRLLAFDRCLLESLTRPAAQA